ncbi:hypothetical protein RRG08_035941 [Elysia crispata]|uniref:Uncharacterized protein n=1 Tax=Elysia crispata TaxID=231223 RepID=A0AAE1ASM6_9GAST|nr:hypothetical protein RRG08_035941 [Elysia crispata]
MGKTLRDDKKDSENGVNHEFGNEKNIGIGGDVGETGTDSIVLVETGIDSTTKAKTELDPFVMVGTGIDKLLESRATPTPTAKFLIPSFAVDAYWVGGSRATAETRSLKLCLEPLELLVSPTQHFDAPLFMTDL